MDHSRLEAFASIPKKASFILRLFLIGLTAVGARIWYLTTVLHEPKEEEAARFRRHFVSEAAMRGTIRDRFHIVLAANSIDYRVGILWSQIQDIPRKGYFRGQKRELRKEYVQALCQMLHNELQLDPGYVGDIIYSYAIFSQTTPIILKAGLTEKQYYRLNMLTSSWPGLVVERASRRIYPQGRTCCHVLGYTAALSRQEFDGLVSEIRYLKDYVSSVERGEDTELPVGITSFAAAKERLLTLERKAYVINDEIGKIGVEAAFERQLRGLSGKKCFITNAKGEYIREAIGSKGAIPGKRLVLTLSAELQEYCEALLAESEEDRSSWLRGDIRRLAGGAKDPIVRGGAIVALDPKTAEVLACASFPRFDPNDFVRAAPSFCHTGSELAAPTERTARWLEDDRYVQRLWDLESPLLLERATPAAPSPGHEQSWPATRPAAPPLNLAPPLAARQESAFSEKAIWLSWEYFLHAVLPSNSPLLQQLSSKQSVWHFLKLQQRGPAPLADLARLLVRTEELSPQIIQAIGPLPIEDVQSFIAAKIAYSTQFRPTLERLFRGGPFQAWRQQKGGAFLKAKRDEEQAAKRANKPFLQYLDKECARQFAEWWDANKDTLFQQAVLGLAIHPSPQDASWIKGVTLAGLHEGHGLALRRLAATLKQLGPEDQSRLIRALKGFQELRHPLTGTFAPSFRSGPLRIGQDLVRTFLSMKSPPLSSFCYMQPSAQGSLFKLVVAHAALQQQVRRLRGQASLLSPSFFQMTDHTYRHQGQLFLGFNSSGKPIPQLYRGGRIPKSVEANLGLLDLVQAIGKSSNPYFALLASEFLESPAQLSQAAMEFGYGERTEISLPAESPGRLPKDLSSNRTGLFTTAIGQHTLLATPLQAAVMLSAIATRGEVLVPKLVKMAIGPDVGPAATPQKHHCRMMSAEYMEAIGISRPIWLSEMGNMARRRILVPHKRLKRQIDMSQSEQDLLFLGMEASIERAQGDMQLKRLFSHRPELIHALLHAKARLLGKTSTAESLELLGLQVGQKPCMYNHTWFGGIFFPTAHVYVDPALVVIVFLRYGAYGKDAAPIAAAVAERWDTIRCRHAQKA